MGHIRDVAFYRDISLKLEWIIEWKFTPGEGVGHIAYPHTILWLVLGGSRHITIRGQTYEIKRGDIVVIPPHVMRNVEALEEHPEPFHYITVCCDLKLGPLELSDLYPFPTVVPFEDRSEFMEMTHLSYKLLHHADDILLKMNVKHLTVAEAAKRMSHEVTVDETVELLALESLFHYWFYRFFKLLRPYLPDTPVSVDARVQKVCVYIQNHLAHPVHIADLAKHIYVSESYLRLLFRKTFGVSPSEYWQQARLRQTKKLLLSTDLTLREISEMVGYGSQNIFSRAFVKMEGISAREYRKRFRERKEKQ